MKITTQKVPLMVTIRARRFLISSVVSWGIIAVLLVVVVIPRIQGAFRLRDQNASAQQSLDALQEKARFLESFKNKEFNQLNDRVQRILPSQKPFLQMLSTLEQLSREQSIFFAGLDVNPGIIASASAAPVAVENARDVISRLDLKLKIFGSNQQISNFMDKINLVAPALEVTTFTSSLQQGSFVLQEASPSAIYVAEINLSSLYAPIGVSSSTSNLPALSKEENEYAKNFLPKYIMYSQDLFAPATSGVGKPDPFAL